MRYELHERYAHFSLGLQQPNIEIVFHMLPLKAGNGKEESDN